MKFIVSFHSGNVLKSTSVGRGDKFTFWMQYNRLSRHEVTLDMDRDFLTEYCVFFVL